MEARYDDNEDGAYFRSNVSPKKTKLAKCGDLAKDWCWETRAISTSSPHCSPFLFVMHHFLEGHPISTTPLLSDMSIEFRIELAAQTHQILHKPWILHVIQGVSNKKSVNRRRIQLYFLSFYSPFHWLLNKRS